MEEENNNRWGFLFSWPSFFIAAWIFFEITSQAFLGVTIFCIKFGWEDYRTAFWLRRKDPDNVRGKMSFWIFTAAGLWKTAITGTILIFVFLPLEELNNRGEVPPGKIAEVGMTAMMGILVSTISTLRACGLANWHGKKIWVDPGIHVARRNDSWPPDVAAGTNQAGPLTTTWLFLISLTNNYWSYFCAWGSGRRSRWPSNSLIFRNSIFSINWHTFFSYVYT